MSKKYLRRDWLSQQEQQHFLKYFVVNTIFPLIMSDHGLDLDLNGLKDLVLHWLTIPAWSPVESIDKWHTDLY